LDESGHLKRRTASVPYSSHVSIEEFTLKIHKTNATVLGLKSSTHIGDDPGGHAIRWYCGFESCRGHGCLSLVNVVSSGRGLWDVSVPHPEESSECGVSVCDLSTSTMWQLMPGFICFAADKALTIGNFAVRHRGYLCD